MLKGLSAGLKSWREVTLAPLSMPLFRALWIAALASNFGAVMQAVAAAWSMAEMTTSPQMVSLVQTASTLPIVLCALPAGALADIADRRLLMLTSQIIGACAAATLFTLSCLSLVSPWTLLAFTAIIGGAVALHQPAWQASLADFVPRTALPAAISLNVMAFNAARSVGPALGGLVIASLGAAAAFALNAVSFLGLIVVLAVNRLPRPERRLPPEPMLSAMVAGMRFVGLSPVIKRVFIRAALFGFGASALWSLMPLVAQQRLGGGPLVYGLLVGALGLGSLAGAGASAWIRVIAGNNRLVNFSVLGFGAAVLGIAFSPWLAASVAFALAAGVSWILVFTTTRTCIQISCPRWVVGRAVSLGQVASFGAMAIGAAFWGALAVSIGLQAVLATSGVFMLATLVFAGILTFPATDHVDVAPPPRAERRQPGITVDPRAGPVVVTIEYHVETSQTEMFLKLMSELGQIRRRNGATQWSIRQDIDTPERWLEHIGSPTWTDHVRRIDRYSDSELHVVAQAVTFRAAMEHPVRRAVSRLQHG